MNECKHEKVMPVYDPEKAKTMDMYEVRTNYPRFSGRCPECGQLVILYASVEHYLMGDW